MDRVSELAVLITRLTPRPGLFDTAVPRLALVRANTPSEPMPFVYEASLCLIAQGSKRVSIGGETVVYDSASYLVVSVDLPLVGHVLEASVAEPYLGCRLDFDRTALAELTLAAPDLGASGAAPALGVYAGEPELIDAVLRLVRLLERPESVPVLAPLVEREILYRLLAGPHGGALRRIARGDGHLGQVGRAIGWIRAHYREPLRVAEVAATAGMSESTLHVHFKAITKLTPIEYQKHLRLQEARRLMLAEGETAGAVGFAVGYESPSQFSREYRRLFGAPPKQDIERLHLALSAQLDHSRPETVLARLDG